jgi:hypothetical protein
MGLQMMTPWTMSIAVRRFFQGLVIRGGRTRLVGLGTLIRLGVSASVLGGGLMIDTLPGIIVATGALSAGVLFEAGFMFWCVRPIVRDFQQHSAEPERPLTIQRFSSDTSDHIGHIIYRECGYQPYAASVGIVSRMAGVGWTHVYVSKRRNCGPGGGRDVL